MKEKNRLEKIQFEVSLVEHCNLNCAMCDHFSPLAEPSYLPIELFKKDIARMSEIFNREASYIYLVGGEPLLHPEINETLALTRHYFPTTDIRIFTNGLKLPLMSESFWKVCSRHNITISVSKYPIKFDYKTILRLMDDKNVHWVLSDPHKIKKMVHCPLDYSGSQNKEENFAHCYYSNNCIQLKNGRLYPCTIAPNVYHLERFLDFKLPFTDNAVDIYNVNSLDDILNLLNSPIDFCRFCRVNERTVVDWKPSSRTKEEW